MVVQKLNYISLPGPMALQKKGVVFINIFLWQEL